MHQKGRAMSQQAVSRTANTAPRSGNPGSGLAGWLLKRLSVARRPERRLAVLERISLAPRQTLALIQVESQRFLVATSADGTPAFYALDEPQRPSSREPSAGVS
jgi:Flagellar biosynthesis protein, FliO